MTAPNPSVQLVSERRSSFWSDYWLLLLFLTYLTSTVVIFALGPIPYPVESPWKLYGFLGSAHLALAAGYVAAMRFRAAKRLGLPHRDQVRSWVPSVSTLVFASSVANIALILPWTLSMTEGSLDLIGALRDPTEAYLRTYYVSRDSTNPFTYPMMFLAPLLSLTVPLTLFYWRRLGWLVRSLALAAVAAIMASAVVVGRNKGLADLFLLSLVFSCVHLARSSIRWRPKKILLAASAVAVVFFLFLGRFADGGHGRMGEHYKEGFVYSIRQHMDFDNTLLRPFPTSVRPAIGHLYSYLTQGYYGLSLSMQTEFTWTYGFGNSYFLHMVQDRFLGSEHARVNCYPAQVEVAFDYGMYAKWHTIYPWLASDLTYPGALLFLVGLGWLLAVVWREVRTGKNPFSVALLATLSIMIFYFNANNQVLGFPVQFASTTGLLALWWLSRAHQPSEPTGHAMSRPDG